MELIPVTLEDKYTVQSGRIYLSGIQALVRLPMMQRERDRAAGLRTAGFISGYRGSPLGGYDTALWQAAKLLEQHDIRFEPGLNEDLAATAVWGTQQVGLFPAQRSMGCLASGTAKGPTSIARSTCSGTQTWRIRYFACAAKNSSEPAPRSQIGHLGRVASE